MLKIGVRLPRQFEDSGDYLADARAMESAGADSLWLEDDGYDPWLLLAGMATITGRIRLVVPVASAELRASGPRAEDRDVEPPLTRPHGARRHRRGRRRGGVDAAIALARAAHCCVILETASDRRAGLADGVIGFSESPERFRAAVEPVAKFREREKLTGAFERWAAIKMPDDRETWRRLRREYEEAGATGIVVPLDPRLLDLLRNSDEEEDRSDRAGAGLSPASGARHHAGEIAHVGRALEPVDRLDDGRGVRRVEHRGRVPSKLLRGFLPGERIARGTLVGTGADRVALPSALDDDLSGPEAGCLV
jgi:hypothetical protein